MNISNIDDSQVSKKMSCTNKSDTSFDIHSKLIIKPSEVEKSYAKLGLIKPPVKKKKCKKSKKLQLSTKMPKTYVKHAKSRAKLIKLSQRKNKAPPGIHAIILTSYSPTKTIPHTCQTIKKYSKHP